MALNVRILVLGPPICWRVILYILVSPGRQYSTFNTCYFIIFKCCNFLLSGFIAWLCVDGGILLISWLFNEEPSWAVKKYTIHISYWVEVWQVANHWPVWQTTNLVNNSSLGFARVARLLKPDVRSGISAHGNDQGRIPDQTGHCIVQSGPQKKTCKTQIFGSEAMYRYPQCSLNICSITTITHSHNTNYLNFPIVHLTPSSQN